MTTPCVVSIVGSSGSGKTTLIEKLIPELNDRGYRIGTVKHTFHPVDMDTRGKDSWRHKNAGAETALLVSPGQVSLVSELPEDRLEAVLSYFDHLDMVIAEGYKREKLPKIEVVRNGRGKGPVCIDDPQLAALVTDMDLNPGVPCFPLDAVDRLADFIETRFLSRRIRHDTQGS
jgi:molybdopterin-guanine dinucleotide biosynthesis adapter protein